MIGITLRHLRYFEALDRHRHFGRAALDCAISQPALSVQIKELEDLLGAALVERGGRQIHLTALGETIATRARDILQSVEALGDLARSSVSALSGRLRIGAIPTVAPYLLPRLIKSLSECFPGLEMQPREAVTKKLVSDLLEGRLDAALMALPASEPSLTSFELFSEEFVLVRHARDARKPVPEPDMLREMRLLLLEEGHCFRDQALSFCKMSSMVPRDIMEGSSLSTLVQMVGAGIGVTLIPEMAVSIERRSANVSVARLPRQEARRTIGMVWRKTNPLAPQLVRMAEAARGLHTPSGGVAAAPVSAKRSRDGSAPRAPES